MREVLAGIGSAVRTGAYDFGGIIVFYLLMWLVGLKAAIAGTLVFVVIDIWRRRRLGLGFPRLYILTTAMALVFGAIDLLSRNPFMLKYEGAASTATIAVFFALGARGTSVIEELVTQKAGAAALAFPQSRRFFQLLTGLWALYYFGMALLYLWIGLHFPYKRAIALRQIAGFVGLGFMMLVSLNGHALHRAFRAVRLLPRAEVEF